MRSIVTFWLGVLLLGCADAPASFGGPVSATSVAVAKTETGLASYYHDKYHGRQTANGEIFNTNEFTAAHRTLPFGSMVRVTLADGKRSVLVRINDRGPFISGRVIDLSRAAARELGIEKAGLAQVKVEVIPPSVTAARR
jgi:rare lipoprotein A